MPCPFKPGDRIRAIQLFERHHYRRGVTYEVVDIDPNDGTLRARDESGETGRWIRWCDCESTADIGWEWLKSQLSAEALELLSAFDGLATLRLRADVREALVRGLPSLKERVVEAGAALEPVGPSLCQPD